MDIETKECKTCGVCKPLSAFTKGKRRSGSMYYRPHCAACKYLTEGRVADKEYMRSYYYENKMDYKYKAYRHKDKKIFQCETIEQYAAIAIMMLPCYYCDSTYDIGLDRKDSSKGHTLENVVSCCEKCNFILGDLPYEAKLALKDGLKYIKNKEILNTWTIPTKRAVKTL